MHWRPIIDWLRTWQGLVTTSSTAVAVLAFVYYSPQKVLQTWDWYWDRFRDNEVFLLISQRKLFPMTPITYVDTDGALVHKIEIPYTVNELAGALNRSSKSIQKSLERLRRHGKIEQSKGGWILRGK